MLDRIWGNYLESSSLLCTMKSSSLLMQIDRPDSAKMRNTSKGDRLIPYNSPILIPIPTMCRNSFNSSKPWSAIPIFRTLKLVCSIRRMSSMCTSSSWRSSTWLASSRTVSSGRPASRTRASNQPSNPRPSTSIAISPRSCRIQTTWRIVWTSCRIIISMTR